MVQVGRGAGKHTGRANSAVRWARGRQQRDFNKGKEVPCTGISWAKRHLAKWYLSGGAYMRGKAITLGERSIQDRGLWEGTSQMEAAGSLWI